MSKPTSFGPADPTIFDKLRRKKTEATAEDTTASVTPDAEPEEVVQFERAPEPVVVEPRVEDREAALLAEQNRQKDVLLEQKLGILSQIREQLAARSLDAVPGLIERYHDIRINEDFADSVKADYNDEVKRHSREIERLGELYNKLKTEESPKPARIEAEEKNRTEELRGRFNKAVARLKDIRNVKLFRNGKTDPETDKKISHEEAEAASELKVARTEMVAADAAAHLEKENKSLLARVREKIPNFKEINYRKALTSVGKVSMAANKKLSAINLDRLADMLGMKKEVDSDARFAKARNATNKFLLKNISLNTAIGLGLGVGVGFGVGTVAYMAWRGWRAGITTGAMYTGSASLYDLVRARGDKKFIASDLKTFPDIVKAMSIMEMRTGLKGDDAREALQADPQYQALLEKYNSIYEKELKAAEAAGFETLYMTSVIDLKDQAIRERLKTDRRAKIALGTLSVASGVLVGLGPDKIKDLLSGAKEFMGSAAESVPDAPINTSTDFVKIQTGSPDASKLGSAVNIDELRPGSIPETPASGAKIAMFDSGKPSAAVGDVVGESSPAVAEPRGKMAVFDSGKPSAAVGDVTPEAEPGKEMLSIEVTSRGIEGTMLDLKDSNPDKYKAMMEWLHQKYPDYKGSDGSIIHKFVSDFAKEKGFEIDSGSSDDLSRILEGKINIGQNGEISFGDIDFMDAKQAAAAAVDTASVAAPEHPISGTPDEDMFGHQHDHPLPPVEAPSAEMRTSLGLEPEPVDYDSLPGTAETLTPTEQMELDRAKLVVAGSMEKTTDGLEMVLGEAKKDFIKERVGLSSKAINKISNMTMGDFEKKFVSDKGFMEDMTKLMAWANKEGFRNHPTMSMKKVILGLANNWKNK